MEIIIQLRNAQVAEDFKGIEDQSVKRTIEMGTQVSANERDFVMPEILAFDHECIMPGDSFVDYSSPLQRKIVEADEVSVVDLK